MTVNELLQILAGFAGAAGFAILFNIRGKKFWAAALGGLLAWALVVLIGKIVSNEPAVYFVVAFAISVYAEIMARVLKTPTTAFIITSLIPLIPGGSLYYTMISVFQTGQGEFLEKGTHTLQLAAALALGIVAVTTLTSAVYRIYYFIKRQKERTPRSECSKS